MFSNLNRDIENLNTEPLKYSFQSSTYNITLTTISDHTASNNTNGQLAQCYSAYPLSNQDFDLEWEKIKAITWRPIRAINCTVAYNLLQNIFSIYDTTDTWLPHDDAQKLALALSITDIPASTLQNVRARAFKAINRLLKLNWQQKNLLMAIESQIKISEKKADELEKSKSLQTSLLVLLSKKEFDSMHDLSSKDNDFYYALQVLSKKYQISLHLLVIDNKNNLSRILNDIPKENTYRILAYSPEYFPAHPLRSSQQNSSLTEPLLPTEITSTIPALNLFRYWNDPTYANWVKNQNKVCQLFCEKTRQIPEQFLLIYWPYVSTMVQAITMLVTVFFKLGGIDFPKSLLWRFSIVFAGGYIGYLRADVTCYMKGDVALERSEQFITKAPQYLTCNAKSKPALRSFQTDLLLLFSCDETFERKKIILNYRISSALYFFGLALAFFTFYSYLGLTFFTAGSGLIYILETLKMCGLAIAVPETTDYNIWWYSLFCDISAISVAALNGFFNQGWDIFLRFSRYTTERKEYYHALLENKTPKPWKKATFSIGLVLILATIYDSFVASLNFGNGTRLATETGCDVFGDFFCAQQVIVPAIVIGCIFLSQTNYSLTLYERDNALWEKVIDEFTPTWIKKLTGFGAESVNRPHLNGHLSTSVHSIFKLDPEACLTFTLPTIDSTKTIATSSSNTLSPVVHHNG